MSTEELDPVVTVEITDFEEELNLEALDVQEEADLCATMASAAQSMDNAGVFNVLFGWPAVFNLCKMFLIPVRTSPPWNRGFGAHL